MSLIKWTETPFEAMERMFQTSIDDIDTRLNRRFGVANDVYVPNLDIAEDKENFYIIAELPGLTENDVKVTVDNNVLTISGKKERNAEKKEQNYHRVERSFGSFARSLTLPKNVAAKAVVGTFKHGLLEITMPKLVTEKPGAREIPLNIARPAMKDGHDILKNGKKTEDMRVHA